jgi:hypothetical protein
MRRLIEKLKRLYDAQLSQTPLPANPVVTVERAERQNENLKLP